VPQENVVTYPGVKGNFLRFQLQSPINRTGNTWHIQAAGWTDGARSKGTDLRFVWSFYGENDGQPLFFSIGILFLGLTHLMVG
jgi:hypothetical protein